MVKITDILVKSIVFLAVIGIIFLLTMYNAKLLNSLNWFITDNPIFTKRFSNLIIIIAAISYSFGSISVVIWYNPSKKTNENNALFNLKCSGAILLKLIFVSIDGLHVYIYSGSSFIGDLSIWLSPLYAAQTALILFFVGAIVNDIIKKNQDKEVEKLIRETEKELKQREINDLESKISNIKSNLNDSKTNIKDKMTVINDYKSELTDLKSKVESKESEIKRKEIIIGSFQNHYFKAEKSRILKKKEDNRTPEENQLLEQAEEYLVQN